MDKLFAQLGVESAYSVQQYRDGKFTVVSDRLAEEVPIALVYNGVSHAVMLATPQDLEDFALGFSITEGILQDKSELYDVELKMQDDGIEVHLEVSSQRFAQLKEHRRSMAGRTGCGLCGTESLDHVFRLPVASVLDKKSKPAIKIASILKANHAIRDLQVLQKITGATHACAWSDVNGNVGMIREDVGRHNAMDKLIGALLKQGKQDGFILTTSRASYEMVQKVAMAGFDLLTAISAPTGLAVRIAEAADVTLLGFVREQQFVAYSHVNRVI
jgi:FdhD protein